MSKVNAVRLIGHVGRKPELKTMDNNVSVITFSLATNESWKNDKGEKQERTDWHNIVAFGNVATLVNTYVQVGSFLSVEGYLRTRQYVTKTGDQRYTTEVIIDEVLFLDKVKDGAPK